MNKIGEIVFQDQSHIPFYETVKIGDHDYDATQIKSIFDYVGAYLSEYNNEIIPFFNGENYYYINACKILYIIDSTTEMVATV